MFSCYTGLSYVDVKELTLNQITIGIDSTPLDIYQTGENKRKGKDTHSAPSHGYHL